MLTVERLREIVHYEPETGVFRLIKQDKVKSRRKVGDIIGGASPTDRYWRIEIDGKRYFGHQLAWLYVYGEFIPEVRHKDGNKLNNAIPNLEPPLVRKQIPLTFERLHEAVDYNKETGLFIWKINSGNSHKGEIAGNFKSGEGTYRQIGIDGNRYYEHQLAWFYIHGIWTDQVDHIDRNKSNNALNNLRPATHRQNSGNSKVNRRNKLGIKGVRIVSTGKYEARLARRTLGYFNTKEEASTAYIDAAKEFFGEFARAK